MTLDILNDTSSPLSSVPSSASSDISDLSELSSTPSPPPEFATFVGRHSYPSPSESQQSSAKTSPAPDTMAATPPSSDNDGGPPRKKRKLISQKERSTERLDLTKPSICESEQSQLDRLLKVLHKKRKIVVIAGAGISVSAGIPDFRSSGGLFSSLRKQHKLKSSGKDLFDASVYQNDSSTSSFHDMVRNLSQKTKTAQPTPFHHLLATLAQEGRLLRLYSQNVDGIDTSLPPLKTEVPLPKKGPWPKTIQLHGGLDHMVCSKCHQLEMFDAEKFDGPVPPACSRCMENDEVRQAAERRSHGIGRLRPRMVLYNEHNPDDEAIGSCARQDLRTRPDAVIVAGTTLKVPGVRRIAREMCAIVRDRRDGVAIWINNDPEPMGKDLANSWDIVVKGPCDAVAGHAAMRKWDDPMDYKEVTQEELDKKKEKQKAEVVVASLASTTTPKKLVAVERVQGQLTPGQSPRIRPSQTLEMDSTEQPSTPSKKGTKRKSGGAGVAAPKRNVKAPVKRQQSQSKKKNANSGSKAKKDSNLKITDQLAISKSSTARFSTTLAKVATKFIPYDVNKKENQVFVASAHEAHDSIAVLAKAPSTPTHGRVTKWKPDSRDAPMADLPSSDARYNSSPTHSPVHPDIEPFTSPFKPDRDLDASRPSTADSAASSRRHEIEHPTGPVPHFVRDILC